MKSSVASMKTDIQNLKRNNQTLMNTITNVASMKDDIQNLKRNNQMLKNTVTNSPTIDSGREAVTVEPISARDLMQEDWMESAPIHNRESGIQWVKKKGTEDWYYMDHTGDWKFLPQ